MNILEAIKIAREKKLNVSRATSWQYFNRISFGSVYPVNTSPGKYDPNWLLTVLGDISESYLLDDDWEIEEEKISVTYSQLSAALNGPVCPNRGGEGVAIDIKKTWGFLKDAVAGKEIPLTNADQDYEEEGESIRLTKEQFRRWYNPVGPGGDSTVQQWWKELTGISDADV